ncbi:MAG: hypothetical protein K0R60_65 [Microbacterium sp.]|jgi:hypothetical protein|nr:hypothetical protein [Microbacterium sp.]
MARGIYKGRPSPTVQSERLRILQGFRMSAREIFAERQAVLAANAALAAESSKGGAR